MISSASKTTTSAALAFAQNTSVDETERGRHHTGHFVNGLGQGQKAEIPGITYDQTRERAIKTGMRFALPVTP